MSANPDAHFGQEIGNHIKPSEPMMKGGHAPGVLVGNDRIPEFHAEQHPAGTAPRENTFQPNPQGENAGPTARQAVDASSTLGGATSADVHQGFGHPGSGQTSKELHGLHKKDGSGLEGVGANPSDPIHDMGADRPYETNKRGKGGAMANEYATAEDREPVGASQIASELN